MPGNLVLPPPEVIAAWPAPNHVDPVVRTWMPAYMGVLQAVTTVLLSTRLFLRSRGKAGALGIDDALLVFGFLGGVMFSAVSVLSTERYGYDRHIYDIDFTQVTKTALMAWLAQIAFLVSTSATKVSVLLSYRRVSSGSLNRYWKWGTIGAIVFTVSYCVAFIGVLIFGCNPVDAYWRAYDPIYATTVNYRCVPSKFLNPLAGGMSVVSDFYAVILPLGLLWNLNISKRQRWALNAVFSLGFLVGFAGIVRTVYLQKLGHTWDLTWVGFDNLVWALLETQLAIICASMPALRIFFRHFFKSTATHYSNSGSGSSSGNTYDTSEEAADGAKVLSTVPAEQFSARDGDADGFVLGNTEQGWMNTSEKVAVPERPVVRTASEYEALALEEIQKFKSSNLYTGWRNSSEEDVKSHCRS